MRTQGLHVWRGSGAVGIDLAVGSLQIRVGYNRRPALSWPGNINHAQVVFLDDPVQVDVEEILPRRRSPMAE